MRKNSSIPISVLAFVIFAGALNVVQPDAVLVRRGKAMAAIYAPAEIVNAEDSKAKGALWLDYSAERQRVRLRNSIRDLAYYLGKMSGAEIEIVPGPPSEDDKRLPVLVDKFSEQRFGKPQKEFFFKQGFRLVVRKDAVGLCGESDLATSYAVYEILHELGCRWFMPSEMGEVIPSKKTIKLRERDESITPYTNFRSIWFADADYGRRNRLGGLRIQMSHALEGYISKEQREEHPDWRAVSNGKTASRRLKWSRPGVAEAIADTIIERADKAPGNLTYSLSPDDGLGYDDTDDRTLDAGDFDPSIQDVSITDRQVWLCNRVIERVEKKHPHLLFGMLSYGQSTRPPVREKPNPKLIPTFAPITYRRCHPMTYDRVPDNDGLRYAIEGWAKLSPQIAYYFYGWLLAEPAAPSPFITKWSEDLRFIYDKGNCKFWDPETMATFENTLPALYLSIRLAWDPTQKIDAIIDEVFDKFYDESAKPMEKYWRYIDSVWIESDEYSGCGFGHRRRWPPEKVAMARKLLDKGIGAAKTPAVAARVRMADESLKQFELFMKLRNDLILGRYSKMGEEAVLYFDRAKELAVKYWDQYAFGGAYYYRNTYKSSYARYYMIFYQKTYEDAARVAKEFDIITTAPLRKWKFMPDKTKKGLEESWGSIAHDDAQWKTTDVGIETWSSIGLHSYMGAVCYRKTVDVADIVGGKKTYLWLGATDGSARVFVNGKHIPFVNARGETKEEFSGYCTPVSFDITNAVKQGENQITIYCVRTFINELGTGGLLAPVLIYRER